MKFNRLLMNVYASGKNFHLFFRNKNGILEYVYLDKFKPYFYASNYISQPIAPINQLKKIIVNYPKDIVKERNKYKYTYVADVLYVCRYLIDYYYFLEKKLSQEKLIELYNSITPRIWYLDIEVYCKNNQFPNLKHPKKEDFINAITIYDNYLQKYISYIVYDIRQGEKEQKSKDWIICYVKNEKELLLNFVNFLQKYYPDIVTGWNLKFDMNMILKRCELFYPIFFKKINHAAIEDLKDRKPRYNEKNDSYEIIGLSQIDYLQLYKKFSLSEKESYALEDIATEELNIGKIKYEQDNPSKLYEQDIEKFILYNKVDVELLVKLEEKLNFLKMINYLKNVSGCPFPYILETSKILDCLIIKDLKHKNQVSKTKDFTTKKSYKGAFVFPPKIGRHEDIIYLDYKSLYPSIIQSLNISPETYVEKLPRKNNELKYYVAGNNTYYLKGKTGIFKEILNNVVSERDKYKKLYKKHLKKYEQTNNSKGKLLSERYYNIQYAMKVLANCFSGDTEIVTLDGIKNIKDVKIGDKVLSVNPKTLEVEIDKVVNTIKEYHYGWMIHFYDVNYNIDLLVTPNHRFLVKDNHCNLQYFVTAEKLTVKRNCYIPKYSINHDFLNKFKHLLINKDIFVDKLFLRKLLFSGYVYCVTTKKNHTVFAGRNGNFCLTGQSFYGFCGYSGSRFFKKELAEAITLTGRDIIFFTKQFFEKQGYTVVAGDSVAKDTKIIIKENGKVRKVKIEDLFEKVDYKIGEKEYYLLGNKNNIKILTLDNDFQITFGKIKYVMRHRVNKKMYRVYVDNNIFVDVTEDHSLIAYSKEKDALIEVKPTDILKNKEKLFLIQANDKDMLFNALKIEKIADNYSDYVYDIEVEETHRFFANGILVHNTDSVFVQVGNLEKINENDLLKDFKPTLDKFVKEKFNCDDNHLFQLKPDAKIKVGIWLPQKGNKEKSAKKRYMLWVVEKDGVKCDKIEVKGLKRSDIPKHIYQFFKDKIYTILLKNPDKEVIEKKINHLKNKLRKMSEKEFAEFLYFPKGITKPIKEYLNKAKKKDGSKYGMPIAVRGALYWNNYIAKRFNFIPIDGEQKIRYYLIKKVKDKDFPMTNVFSNPYTYYPEELTVIFEIDRELMIKKIIDEHIKQLYDAMDWKWKNENDYFKLF